jgi:hypothetical protein
MPGYGIRRIVLDAEGRARQELRFGEHKAIQSDRVILAHGTAEEVRTVQWIFHAYAIEGQPVSAITKALNKKGVRYQGRPWRWDAVRGILKNERYTGTIVWNRRNQKLKGPVRWNPPDLWVRAEQALEPMIPRSLFEKAQNRPRELAQRFQREKMLEGLRALFHKHGYLNWHLVTEDKSIPCVGAYRREFGTLTNAFELIGYTQPYTVRAFSLSKRCGELTLRLVGELGHQISAAGGRTSTSKRSLCLRINGEIDLALVVVPLIAKERAPVRWDMPALAQKGCDLLLLALLAQNRSDIHAFYLFPSHEFSSLPPALHVHNDLRWEAYRVPELAAVVRMTARTDVRDAH